MKRYKVPTGDICIINGDHNLPLEFLSIGDYGKEKNLKADFMGLTKEINGVPHGELLPLEKKWVITISSQYGCSMNCTFCDVPKVGIGLNSTYNDLINQVLYALELHPEVKTPKRINLHYARMGEPTFNMSVIDSACFLSGYFKSKKCRFHPVISTMMPKNNNMLKRFLIAWLRYKNNNDGEAGLQISINTTDYKIRQKTMSNSLELYHLSTLIRNVLSYFQEIKGRKITLNFALTEASIDAEYLRTLFDPEIFLCKITPMHNTQAVIKNNMITDNGYTHYYPYKEVEENLKRVGFDVIVFIPSKEEDESKITCGNVILADSNIKK